MSDSGVKWEEGDYQWELLDTSMGYAAILSLPEDGSVFYAEGPWETTPKAAFDSLVKGLHAAAESITYEDERLSDYREAFLKAGENE